MKTLPRRLLAILSIAAGTFAAVLFVTQLTAVPPNFFAYLALGSYTGIACWGIFAGVMLLEQDSRARWHSIGFWACQVPVLFLPGFGHKLGIGVWLFVWVEYPLRYSAFFGTGADFKSTLFKVEGPIIIGSNVIALALMLYSYHALPRARRIASDGI